MVKEWYMVRNFPYNILSVYIKNNICIIRKYRYLHEISKNNFKGTAYIMVVEHSVRTRILFG